MLKGFPIKSHEIATLSINKYLKKVYYYSTDIFMTVECRIRLYSGIIFKIFIEFKRKWPV